MAALFFLATVAASLAPCATLLGDRGGDRSAANRGGGRRRGPKGRATQRAAEDLQDPETQAIIDECFEIVRHLMEEFPNSSDPIALMGGLHQQFGNTEEAVQWWHKCLERKPDRADIYHGLGMVAMDREEYDKAEELWRKAKQMNPDLPGVYWRHGRVLLALGRTQEAVASLEQQAARNPDKGSFWLDLGKAYLQNGDFQKAVEASLQARRLLPEDSRPAYTLMQAHARLGNAEKAAEFREEFQRFRAQENKVVDSRRRAAQQRNDRPHRVLAWTLTKAGRLYAGHRRLGKAEALWRRAVSLDPTDPDCRRSLAGLYMATRRPRQALHFCREVLRLRPGSPQALQNTGVVLMILGKFDEAEAMLRKAVDLDPGRPTAVRPLVRVLIMQRDDTDEALALAKHLAEAEDSAEDYALLGEARLLAGDRDGARAALDAARQRHAQHPACRRLAGLLKQETE